MKKDMDLLKVSSTVLMVILILVLNVINPITAGASIKSAITTTIYLLSFGIYIFLGLKYNLKSMITFNKIIWTITLITSILAIVSNILDSATPNLVTLYLYFVGLFLSGPLLGVYMITNNLIASSTCAVISILFLSIPIIFKSIQSKKIAKAN